MDVFPLGPGFAAELRGIDLIDVVSSDCAYRAVREAFEEHSWPPSSRRESYPMKAEKSSSPRPGLPGQHKEELRDLVVAQRAVIFRGSGITQGS